MLLWPSEAHPSHPLLRHYSKPFGCLLSHRLTVGLQTCGLVDPSTPGLLTIKMGVFASDSFLQALPVHTAELPYSYQGAICEGKPDILGLCQSVGLLSCLSTWDLMRSSLTMPLPPHLLSSHLSHCEQRGSSLFLLLNSGQPCSSNCVSTLAVRVARKMGMGMGRLPWHEAR